MRKEKLRQIERGLQQSATVSNRLNALRSAGLPIGVIASTLSTSESSMRNWVSGTNEPRPETYDRLDSLRLVMGQLITKKGMDPDEASNWLLSRSDQPPHQKPIEELVQNPVIVFDKLSQLPDVQ